VVRIIAIWLEALFTTLPQTVKVISEAGRVGVRQLLEYSSDDHGNPE